MYGGICRDQIHNRYTPTISNCRLSARLPYHTGSTAISHVKLVFSFHDPAMHRAGFSLSFLRLMGALNPGLPHGKQALFLHYDRAPVIF